MKVQVQMPLFAWQCLEDSPSLVTIRRIFDCIPDGQVLEGLRAWRGHGRDDYPVQVLWRVVLLRIMLRHRDVEACLGELKRNPTLQKLVGIESAKQVPNGWNVSRFLEVLGQEPHRSHVQEVFNVMVQRLGVAVPDLGKGTAGDSTWLNARRTRADAKRHQEQVEQTKAAAAAKQSAGANGSGDAVSATGDTGSPQQAATGGGARVAKAQAEPSGPKAAPKIELDQYGLPQPAGGRKEYTGEDGRVTRVVEWFGFKLHLLVDTRHEVSLAYHVSSTKAGDNEVLPALVDQGQSNLPPGRIETLAYDKAADDAKVHRKLRAAGIKPVIQNRSLWKGEDEKMLPGHDGNSNIVYDEAGTLHCYDTESKPIVRHRMAYIGHEPSRGTLKYRCPAVHEGWECSMSRRCNAGKKYGLTVRVKQEIDVRRFPAIPRATKQFERLYKGRPTVERVNARLKIFWGVDDGNVTGAARFHAQVGTVMIVHEAFATVLASLPRREGTLGRMRLSPIAKAIDAQIRGVELPPKAPRAKKRRCRDKQPSLFR